MIEPGPFASNQWIAVVSPSRGNSWATLFGTDGYTSYFSPSGDETHFEEMEHGDQVFCYDALPNSAIVATAVVGDVMHAGPYDQPQVVLTRGRMLRTPIPFDELIQTSLRTSQAIQNNLRGSLHRISPWDAQELLDLAQVYNPFEPFPAPPLRYAEDSPPLANLELNESVTPKA